ncbi:MAG TPA: tetratricopeptide repeat protein [Pyrinomonadaceae bacterium]|jgi:Flp pilus assembly protein TadD
MAVRTRRPNGFPPYRLLALTAALAASLCAFAGAARAQSTGIGAHRGDTAGTGGRYSIQGHIISPLGRLPETRVRITITSSNSGARTGVAGEDGVFLFNNLEPGPYDVTIDAGREFEVQRESVYLGGSAQMTTLPVYLRLKPESNPALAGVPKAALDLFVRAQEAARKGDAAKAEALLGEAVAQHPQFGLAHNELGLVRMRAGQLDKALEAYRAAARALPDDPSVQLNYGTALTQKKEFAEAETQLRRALRKFDKSAAGHMYLGVALIGLKNIDEAERELQQAARLGGEQMGAAHKYLGGIYWAKRDYRKAADALETYLKLSPKAPDAEQVRATIKDLRGKS